MLLLLSLLLLQCSCRWLGREGANKGGMRTVSAQFFIETC